MSALCCGVLQSLEGRIMQPKYSKRTSDNFLDFLCVEITYRFRNDRNEIIFYIVLTDQFDN